MAPHNARVQGLRGTVIVEVAIATVVVFMLILSIIDLGRMHFSRSRVQYAVSQATRFATTGNTLADPANPKKQLSRTDSIKVMIQQLAGLKDLADADIVLKATNAAGVTANGAGGPGDVITVQVTYRVPVLAPYLSAAFPKGRFVFTCATTYRNEEFS